MCSAAFCSLVSNKDKYASSIDAEGWTNVAVVQIPPEFPRGPRQIFAPRTSCAKF